MSPEGGAIILSMDVRSLAAEVHECACYGSIWVDSHVLGHMEVEGASVSSSPVSRERKAKFTGSSRGNVRGSSKPCRKVPSKGNTAGRDEDEAGGNCTCDVYSTI